MPDWTYRTLLRPVLFRLPPEPARRWTLHALAQLARWPGGSAIIEFFGHMRADPRLATQFASQSFPSSVGLGAAIDPQGIALGALSRFGVGFVMVGPVGRSAVNLIARLSGADETLTTKPDSISAENLAACLQRWGSVAVPLWIRIADTNADSAGQITKSLAAHGDGFFVEPTDNSDPGLLIASVVESAAGKPVWLGVEAQIEGKCLEKAWKSAMAAGATGISFFAERSCADGRRIVGRTEFPAVLEQVRQFRNKFGIGPGVAAGGAHSPADALQLRLAGANLISLDTGLIFSGPGLPKRVNEALLAWGHSPAVALAAPEPAPSRSWFWFLLMGVGMFGGGLLALVIASTRVVLPYDEVFCGMTRDQLSVLNPRLLAFMAHDRVTLAGTMITAGVLYSRIAWFGMRRGQHWAKLAITVSATTGFFSFFLFLGFGYFDPFHAFVSAILFQFLLLGLHSPLDRASPTQFPELSNSRAWQRGQWGQLLFVGLGVGLVGAGLVICYVGITQVFVTEDLAFMQTSAEALRSANPRLVPLVAHDRASLGGMLMACGLAVWLTAQWGFRAGERWLWWTLLLSGLPAFGAAIGIHLMVGYLSFKHLAPAFAALLWFGLALALSHGWLTEPEAVRRDAWRSSTIPKSPSVN